MVIRAGNGTSEAAKTLGWTQYRGGRVDDEPLEATAYALVDNQSAKLAGGTTGNPSRSCSPLPDELRA